MEENRYPCKNCGKPTLVNIISSRNGICIPCSRTEREEHLRSSLADTGQSFYPTAAMLLANKNHEYQERILSCAQAIAEFYTESQLTTSDLCNRFHSAPETFSFTDNDLNDQGKAFARDAFTRWLKGIDRWVKNADRSTNGYKSSLYQAYDRHTKHGG